MNRPGVVEVCFTRFPQLLVWERNQKPEVRREVKKNQKETWPCFCPILFEHRASPNLLPLHERFVHSKHLQC